MQKDWKSAEHLIEYPKQYEYAIELKTNPNNIKGKGSAIFLHCSVNKPTAGCIAIEKEKMQEIFQLIKKDATINIGDNIYPKILINNFPLYLLNFNPLKIFFIELYLANDNIFTKNEYFDSKALV